MILLSGSTGFIGRALLKELLAREKTVRCLVRENRLLDLPEYQRDMCTQLKADLSDFHSLVSACRGVNIIYHCAGYAHAFGNTDAIRHWKVNFLGTKNLVEAAVAAGVKIFVFLSSVKAMAETGSACADEDWPGSPETSYGQAKRAAEEIVLAAGSNSGLRVVILRLAMVYGPGGRGNLDRMGTLIRRGLFPPLPETGNRRSLVHVYDVVEVMQRVAYDKRATGKIYIVAEPNAYSGRQIYENLCRSCGRRPCSWAVPKVILQIAAYCGDVLKILWSSFPFSSEVLDRLIGSAWYTPARIEREIGWRANRSFEDMAEHSCHLKERL